MIKILNENNIDEDAKLFYKLTNIVLNKNYNCFNEYYVSNINVRLSDRLVANYLKEKIKEFNDKYNKHAYFNFDKIQDVYIIHFN